MECVIEETKHRENEEVLDLASYTSLRRGNSAVDLVFSILSVVLGVDYPDSIFEDPLYAKMHLEAEDMVAWSNVRSSYTTFAKIEA